MFWRQFDKCLTPELDQRTWIVYSNQIQSDFVDHLTHLIFRSTTFARAGGPVVSAAPTSYPGTAALGAPLAGERSERHSVAPNHFRNLRVSHKSSTNHVQPIGLPGSTHHSGFLNFWNVGQDARGQTLKSSAEATQGASQRLRSWWSGRLKEQKGDQMSLIQARTGCQPTSMAFKFRWVQASKCWVIGRWFCLKNTLPVVNLNWVCSDTASVSWREQSQFQFYGA